jgi:hypothetical protein
MDIKIGDKVRDQDGTIITVIHLSSNEIIFNNKGKIDRRTVRDMEEQLSSGSIKNLSSVDRLIFDE